MLMAQDIPPRLPGAADVQARAAAGVARVGPQHPKGPLQQCAWHHFPAHPCLAWLLHPVPLFGLREQPAVALLGTLAGCVRHQAEGAGGAIPIMTGRVLVANMQRSKNSAL